MPSVGQSSFLRHMKGFVKLLGTGVNALSRAILIYAVDYYEVVKNGVCVNALSRAILISTLPLWNRLF